MPACRHFSSAAGNIHCTSVGETPMTGAPSSFSTGLAYRMSSLGLLRRDDAASIVGPSLLVLALEVASAVIGPVIVGCVQAAPPGVVNPVLTVAVAEATSALRPFRYAITAAVSVAAPAYPGRRIVPLLVWRTRISPP